MKLMVNMMIEVPDKTPVIEAQRIVNMAENYVYNMERVEDVAAGVLSISWNGFEGSPDTIARLKVMTPLPVRG